MVSVQKINGENYIEKCAILNHLFPYRKQKVTELLTCEQRVQPSKVPIS